MAPPSNTDNRDSISVGLDGGIGGVDSSECPLPDQIDYPNCYPSPSPTDGGGSLVSDPPVGDTLPPTDPSAAPGDGEDFSPEPT
ncbi:hypothetical protein AQJ23_31740 [Streptomyces antibioticus]|nr:hypothetical protein AQJ23_31740 [Streptomyces antibioticus]